MVKLGQYVGAAPPQCAAELGKFFQCVGNTAAQCVDDRGHHGVAAASVGVGVGSDHALIEAPAQLDGEVGIFGEN